MAKSPEVEKFGKTHEVIGGSRGTHSKGFHSCKNLFQVCSNFRLTVQDYMNRRSQQSTGIMAFSFYCPVFHTNITGYIISCPKSFFSDQQFHEMYIFHDQITNFLE